MPMRYIFLILIATVTMGAKSPPREDYSALIEIGDATFETEVADTVEKMQRGMMYRPQMADNQAMIFVFPSPRKATFWMKNTLIPLDMLFFDGKGILREVKHNVPPCDSDDCPTYPTQSEQIKYVVELKGGTAEKRQLVIGDKLNGCGF